MVGIAATVLVGCGSSERPLDDREKIVRSVLGLLVSTGKPVCTDDQTAGDALAEFREMALAPRASRADLRWHAPLPLRPDARVTTQDIKRSEFNNEKLEINEPGVRKDALPGLEQLQLDGAAQRLGKSVGTIKESVAVRRSWAPPGVVGRWWPLNRLRRDCWPRFEISDPVRDRELAFVSVRAEHWGTLYALRQTSGEWRVTAEWSRWLY
ncbi:hypothetical protein [Sphingomonas sp.]|uniref:hypothetical protein n=1 Tax=Sphingomonas sp. TaxID=28214 RepID=UPI002EDACFDA